MALTPEQVKQGRALLRGSVSQPKKTKTEEKKKESKRIKVPGLQWISDTFAKPIVETLAKPVGEVVASGSALLGKETPVWASKNRLAGSGLRSLSLPKNDRKQFIEESRARGEKGATFTDILNVASIAPAGVFARAGQTLGTAGKIATGAEKFGAATFKNVLKAGATGAKWGGAYGIAGAVDEREKASDVAMSGLKGAAFGGLVGGGLGVAAGLVGGAAGLAARKTSPEFNAKITRAERLKQLQAVQSSNSALRKLASKEERFGQNSQKLLADTDLLVGSVDDSGTIRTKASGGAVDTVRDFIKPQDSVVREIVEREGSKAPIDDLRRAMVDDVKQRTSGADQTKAVAKIDSEIRAFKKRYPDGFVPLSDIHDLKVYKGQTTNFMSEPFVQASDKSIVRGAKEIVEKYTKSADVKAINKELAKYYSLIDYLEALDGKKVKGGRLGKYFAQTTGAILGGQVGGVPGGLIGADIASRIQSQLMQSTFGGKTGGFLERAPVLKEASELAKSPRLMLPPGRPGGPRIEASGPVIPLGSGFTSEAQSPVVSRTSTGLNKPPLVKPFLQREFESRMPTQTALPAATPGASGPVIPLRGKTVIDMGKQTKSSMNTSSKIIDIPSGSITIKDSKSFLRRKKLGVSLKEKQQLFHGTNAKFDSFELRDPVNGQSFGRGVYLTEELKRAKNYGENVLSVELSDSANVLPLMSSDAIPLESAKTLVSALNKNGISASFENGWITSDLGNFDTHAGYQVLTRLFKSLKEKKMSNKILPIMEAAGVDALSVGVDGRKTFVIFNPTKIKIRK